MAIDEKHLDDLTPDDLAVDRLRKRNKRIRPWETSLVGSTSLVVTSVGGDDSPSGQFTQRGVDKSDSESLHETKKTTFFPTGEIPPEQNTPELAQHVVKIETVSYPEGILSSESKTLTVNHLEDQTSSIVLEKLAKPAGEPPRRQFDPKVNGPEGVLTRGHVAYSEKNVGCSPARSNSICGQVNQRVNNPKEERSLGTSHSLERNPVALLVDSDGGFDPRPFLPQRQSTLEWREKGHGEFRIPHRLFEFVQRVTTTRNELLVLNCLLRFSLGFHRTSCEAGYSFIASWTGISDLTNVRKSIRSLVESGIVRKIREHNCASNSGSVYELPVVEAYLNYLKASRTRSREEDSTSSDVDSPSGATNQRGNYIEGSGQNDQTPMGETPPKKERSNQNSKKSLSQSLPTDLIDYLDQVRPATKRESEVFFLEKLLKEYTATEIDSSLQYVLKFGVLGKGEKCYSPIRYLSTSMEQVRAKVMQQEAMQRPIHEVISLTSSIQFCDKALTNKQTNKEALQEFESIVSKEEQEMWVDEVRRENTEVKFGYVPPIAVLKSMAAIKWLQTKVKAKAIG